MDRYELIAIVNDEGERKLIRKDDFDADEHTKWKERSEGSGDSKTGENEPKGPEKTSTKDSSDEDDTQHEFGDYKAVELEDSPGWWNVIHMPTQEFQSEKNKREDEAIALAQKLADNG